MASNKLEELTEDAGEGWENMKNGLSDKIED
jgi:hypothetical protein